jgi:hypothetical protein
MLVATSCASRAHAAEAAWSFEPASWDFGTIVPGTGPSPPKAFTLTNTGETDLQVFLVSIGSEGDFSLAGNTCGKLAPGASCEISATFDPSSAGAKRGQLDVASLDGLAPPASVELRGTGAGPTVSITPSKQSFDPLQLGGGPSAPRVFTIANKGQLDLTISSISIQPNQTYNYPGASAQQFDLAGGTCEVGVAVPPESACTVKTTFSPSVPGLLTAQLRITDNAPGTPHVADLEGVGNAPPWQPLLIQRHPLPRVSIVHRPSRLTSSPRASFWLRLSTTATRFACKLDDGPTRPCTSPVRYLALDNGRHRFSARALDQSGRWGPRTTFQWRIERPK